jgi:hypothetical protein
MAGNNKKNPTTMKSLLTIIAAIFFTANVNAQNSVTINKGVTINKNANGAAISWTASNESNTSQFEVEISYDNQSFQSIRTVAASETTKWATNYEAKFKRTYLSVDKIYYRVKTVFIDGSSEVTAPVALEVKGTNGAMYASIH